MVDSLGKMMALCSEVKNPGAALLDRMGLRQAPYTLHLRNGGAIELRPKSGDLFGFYEIMLRRDYLAAGQRLGPGSTVIDVGANIGCFTLVAARIVGPNGRVFALEPEESTYSQLLRNIELNGLTNITPLRLAVGATQGAITLHADANRLFSSLYTSVNGHQIAGRDQEVRMTTLAALMDEHGIGCCDYLKLDCEGAEHEIVASMPQSTAARIAQITMEVHKVPGFDGQSLRQKLEQLGYERVGATTLPYYARAAAARGPEVERKQEHA
ncbi:MAG: FkbM family methyltransferase [Burkholderiales bacterium]|nr:FkbM family methyltransferase [Burkholderiales bacterium]